MFLFVSWGFFFSFAGLSWPLGRNGKTRSDKAAWNFGRTGQVKLNRGLCCFRGRGVGGKGVLYLGAVFLLFLHMNVHMYVYHEKCRPFARSLLCCHM